MVTIQNANNGTCNIYASLEQHWQYFDTPESLAATLYIQGTGQAIVFDRPPDTTYSPGGTVLLSASSTSGLYVTVNSTTPSVCTVSDHTATLTGTGTCTLQAVQWGDTNHFPADPVTQSFAVHKANQAVAFTSVASNPVYNGTYAVTTAGGGSDQPVILSIDGTSTAGACTLSGGTVSFTGAGTCVINANQAGNANYNAAAQVQQTIAIAKAAQAIAFTSAVPASPTIGGNYVVAAAGGASSQPVVFAIDAASTAGACSIAGATVSFTGAGNCIINANRAGDANYNAAGQIQQSFAISKIPQSVSFAKPADVTFAPGGTVTLSATATSGLTVTFASTTTGVCTVSGSTVTMVSPGGCSITASQAGNTSYAAAPDVAQNFGIGKISQSISFARPADVTFAPGGTVTLSATATSGLAVTFSSTTTGVCTVSGTTVSIVNPGSCSITASQSGDASYAAAPDIVQSFMIGKISQSISFARPADTMFTPGGTIALSATATSGLAVTFASTTTGVCTVSGTTVTLVSAGTCSITASQAGNASYAAAPDIVQSFVIGRITQTITFTKPSDIAFAPGGTVALSATATSGLAVTFVSTTTGVCTVSGATVTIRSAGLCSITASQAGNVNYSPALDVTQSFNVTGEPKITATATVSPTSFSRSGETLLFLITLSNTGGAAATGIRLAEPRLTGITCAATTVPAGGEIKCQGTTQTTAADLSAGRVSINPRLTYTYGGANP